MFYQPQASLLLCPEGSLILLALVATLEAFDFTLRPAHTLDTGTCVCVCVVVEGCLRWSKACRHEEPFTGVVPPPTLSSDDRAALPLHRLGGGGGAGDKKGPGGRSRRVSGQLCASCVNSSDRLLRE